MTTGVFNDVTQFEQRLNLPSGFYDKLLQEDDWSFVVKLSALFEAACTYILVKRLHTPELEESLAELDHANKKYGKIILLKKLGAITNEQSKVLHDLATLRNKLVHKISNVGFTFEAHIRALDDNQTTALLNTFGHGITEEISLGDRTVTRRGFVLSNPKLALWLTAAEILACLYLEIEAAQLHLQEIVLEKYANLALRTSTGSA